MNKVKVGFFSFTEITDPSEHRSYNEWHQLDHMPEQYPLPGMAFGQRWVSTPACRAARTVDGPLLAPIHYVTLYLMTEPVEPTLEEFHALGGRLRERGTVPRAPSGPSVGTVRRGRPWPPRRVCHLGRSRSLPAESGRLPRGGGSPDAPSAPTGVDTEALLGHGRGGREYGASSRTPSADWSGDPGHRRITVCYLDEAPLDVSSALAAVVGNRDSDTDGVIHAGPLETVIPWRWDWFDAEATAGS